MSLILEALKKIERDKPVPDRGFLIMAAPAWSGSSGQRMLVASVALAAVGVFGLATVGVWWWKHGATVSAPATPLPAAAPVGPGYRAPAASTTAPFLPAPSRRQAASPPPSNVARAPVTRIPAPAAEPAAEAPAPIRAPDTSGGVHLTATSVRDGRPVAMINDHMVYEGDLFDGIKVLHIEEGRVEVEVNGERRTVHFQ